MIPSTIFHEPWWLDAVCPHGWEEAVVTEGGEVVARLPYLYRSNFGIRSIGMPPLTRTLGPQLRLTETSPGARLHQEELLVKELVALLPAHHYFFQICSPGFGNGLSFLMQGYEERLAYTFRIPVERPLDQVWLSMRDLTRQAIRKAGRACVVDCQLDIEEFCAFYNANLETNHQVRRSAKAERWRDKPKIRLFDAGKERKALCLLAARDDKGTLVAAIMPVWAHGVMHYFLTTRSPAAANSGAVALLVWNAIKLAKELGVVFDFDGFARPEAASFIAGFGGDLVNRIVVVRESRLVGMARDLSHRLRPG